MLVAPVVLGGCNALIAVRRPRNQCCSWPCVRVCAQGNTDYGVAAAVVEPNPVQTTGVAHDAPNVTSIECTICGLDDDEVGCPMGAGDAVVGVNSCWRGRSLETQHC